jgi:gliding motility-associated-like protein
MYYFSALVLKTLYRKLMKNLAFILILSVCFLNSVRSQYLISRWQYGWGGNNRDYLANMIPLTGNTFLFGGTSQSTPMCTKTSVNYGGEDMALFVLDDDGNQIWEKSYGGGSTDRLWEVKKVPAGGYILVGETSSGPSGIKTSPNYGNEDIWIVRVDNAGNLLWERTYGTSQTERGVKIIPTTDGGFLIAGNYLTGMFSYSDYQVTKIDASGNRLWSKSYGGSNDDVLFDMVQMANGNFLLSGKSNSSAGGIKTAPLIGAYDHWIICIQADGTQLWDKTYGSLQSENGGTLLALSDGNYLLAGDENFGANGIIRKLNPQGNQLWGRTCGPGLFRMATQADDGKIYVAGESYSVAQGCKTSPLNGINPDYWITVFDLAGNKVGDMDYGGTADDYIITDIRANDKDVWILGQTNSPVSGNKTAPHCGSSDGWIIRLSHTLFVRKPTPDDICSNNNNINVHYTAYGAYQSNNIFTAQLSDANGSFSTFTNIGAINSTASGIIPVTFPVTLAESDKYRIRVVASSFADTSAGYSIIYRKAPQLFLGNDTTICDNIPITLVTGAQTTGTTFLWSDGSTGNTLTVSTAGTYSCNVQNTCGTVSDAIQITTKTFPIADIGSDRNFCEGTSIILQSTPQAADVTYLWNTGATSPSVAITTGGSYQLKTTNACGFTSDAITVTMDPRPKNQFNKDTVLCYGTTRLLDAGSGYANYLWYDGQGGETRTVDRPGEYWVHITGSNGCVTRDTANIKRIIQLPATLLPADTILCSYDNLVLKPAVSFKQYNWSTGDIFPSITVEEFGLYWLQGTDVHGCTTRDSISIGRKDCLFGFFMPTAFSPNNDGRNEWCMPRIFGKVAAYHFTIFNRWGQKVFDSRDRTRGWDGKINGRIAETGAYVWSCVYQFNNEPEQRARGTVMLIR